MEELNILEKELNLIQKDFDNVSSVLVNLMNVASKKQDIQNQPRFVLKDFEQYLIKLMTHDVLPTKKERFAVRDVSTGREPQPEVKPDNKPAIDPKDNEQAPEKLNENKRKYDSRDAQEIARMTRQKYKHLDEINALRQKLAKFESQSNSQFTEDNFASREAFEQWKKSNEQAPEHTDYEAEEAVETFNESLRERYKEDPATLNRETMALMREQKVNPIGGFNVFLSRSFRMRARCCIPKATTNFSSSVLIETIN